jgi:hypothetical protein
MQLTVSAVIGSGRIAAVYAVDVQPVKGVSIPPLAIKPTHAEGLLNEASFYDHVLSYQGSGIARCYGFFQSQ